MIQFWDDGGINRIAFLGRVNVMIGDFNETGVTNYSFLPNSLRNLKNKNNQIKYYYYYTQSKIFKHEGDK